MTDSGNLVDTQTSPTDKLFKSILSSPWLFIPAIYLVQGIIEAGILQEGTAIMYKEMGYSNALIGYLALLQMPLTFAFLWAPYVDKWGSKRNLSIIFFFCSAICTGLVALVLYFNIAFTAASITIFLCLAIIFSFFRISADGYYIRILKPSRQASFIGIKTTAIRLGIIITGVCFIRHAAQLNEARQSETAGWLWMYITLTAVIFVGAIYNLFCLPKAEDDKPVRNTKGFALLKVVREYLKQDKILIIIAFLLLYRFGEGLLIRMSSPFFLDPIGNGGYGISLTNLTDIKFAAGMPCITIGGIAGGWIVKQWGLKRTFLWLALLMAIPNLAYVYLAKTQSLVEFSLFGLQFNRDMFIVVCLESLGYGVGFSAFFYYLHALAVGANKTSLFAISTALMGLGFNIPCVISGKLQEIVGYPMLFLLSFLLALPAIFLIRFLPIPKAELERMKKQ